MHNEIQVFTNEKFGSARTTVIDGKPWFVGRDVAEALGYESPRSAVSKKLPRAKETLKDDLAEICKIREIHLK